MLAFTSFLVAYLCLWGEVLGALNRMIYIFFFNLFSNTYKTSATLYFAALQYDTYSIKIAFSKKLHITVTLQYETLRKSTIDFDLQ